MHLHNVSCTSLRTFLSPRTPEDWGTGLRRTLLRDVARVRPALRNTPLHDPTPGCDLKQLFDEFFVISGIIKVEVSVIHATSLFVNLTLLLEIMRCERKLRIIH